MAQWDEWGNPLDDAEAIDHKQLNDDIPEGYYLRYTLDGDELVPIPDEPPTS